MNDKKETLVILSPGFPASEADTACLPAHQVFVRAVNKVFPQMNVVIVAFQYPYAQLSYQWNGNTVISLNGRRKGKAKRMLLWLKAWRTLKKIKNRHNVKGILSFWLNECALVGKYFGRLFNIKHYAWITGQDAKKGNIYVRLMRPRANEVFAMSQFLSNQFLTNYGIKPCRVITNGIDVDLFDKQCRERSIDIFAAGSLIPLKQYDVWVQVVKRVSEKMPGVQAVLCGKGPEEKKLADMISSLALDENIQLAGEMQHKQVLSLMQQSKVFLHTSNYEGFSTVCLEALYAGAHVVSFIKPMEASIEHWHIVKTPEEMAQKALQILLEPKTEYTPVLPYAMHDVAQQVLSLY